MNYEAVVSTFIILIIKKFNIVVKNKLIFNFGKVTKLHCRL